VADNARRYPRARILAVELDPGNAEAARRNTRPYADRVEILQGAVWTEDGEVPYEHETGGEHGFRVDPGARGTTTALSMATILSRIPETERIDSIALQVHDPYTLDDCARDLKQLGFEPEVVPRRMNFIKGVRRRAP
jgi:hypothetical protein